MKLMPVERQGVASCGKKKPRVLMAANCARIARKTNFVNIVFGQNDLESILSGGEGGHQPPCQRSLG